MAHKYNSNATENIVGAFAQLAKLSKHTKQITREGLQITPANIEGWGEHDMEWSDVYIHAGRYRLLLAVRKGLTLALIQTRAKDANGLFWSDVPTDYPTA